MAADLDKRPTSSLPNAITNVGRSYIMDSVTIDFSVAANNLAQNEVVAVYDIPAMSAVEFCVLNVTTADTDVTDVNVGISATGATANDLIDAGTLAAVGLVGNATALPPVKVLVASQLTLTNIDADTLNGAVVQFILKVTPLD